MWLVLWVPLNVVRCVLSCVLSCFVGKCFCVRIRKVWDDGICEGEGDVVHYSASVFVYSFINS
jgi:hypothetical protein